MSTAYITTIMGYESFDSMIPILIKPCSIMYAGRTEELADDESVLRHAEISRQLRVMHPLWSLDCIEGHARIILRNEKDGIKLRAGRLATEIEMPASPKNANIDKLEAPEYVVKQPRKLGAAAWLSSILAGSKPGRQ